MASATLSNQIAAQSKSVRLLIDGERFDLKRLQDPSQAEAFQQALDNARHKFGYALCMCRPNSQKLQIRLREGKYHLAVWPDQGHQHDTNCLFFREDDDDTAAEIHAKVHEHEDGSREIRLNFALDRSTLANNPRPHPTSRLTVDDHKIPEQASLRGLLHLMWHEASLTRWHPSWERDWGRARYELVQAAHRMTVKGESLASRVFVPRPYRESIKEDLNLEWDRFVTNLSRPSGTTIKSAILIAPVRKFVDLPNKTASMHLRHLRSPIGLNESTFDFLQRNCRTAVRRVMANAEAAERAQEPKPAGWVELKQPEVIAIAHVEANSRGGLWARGIWLLSVHPQVFIPASNSDEVLLIDALLRGGYQFNRLLTSEQPIHRKRPEWFVRHVYDPLGKPVPRAALEILSNGATQEYVNKRAELADSLANQGVPVWTWTPLGRQLDRKVPALPPLERLPGEYANEILRTIRGTDGLFYAYGSGREPINL